LFVLFYDIFLFLYHGGIRIASLWNIKAKKWQKGRKEIFPEIKSAIGDLEAKVVWVHCSSLGEFEQGRPVIERIRTQGIGYKILLTFFSPSGYEVRKDYEGADYVFYLPPDSKQNAKKFMDITNPSLVIWIKYDYWYHYLNEIKHRNINCLLISAAFRKNQLFFKWYGKLQKKMLFCFSHIFVQDEISKKLLASLGLIEKCTIAGDTRFDRVVEIGNKFEPIPVIEQFIDNKKCIVAGSTWKTDEEILQKAFFRLNTANLKLIIAPHEIHQTHLDEIKKLLPESIRLSEIDSNKLTNGNILIIDNIGMLSRLYKYAYIAYVGGGFTKDGVHNVLEAAVYGKPVIFGKNYKKYKEAVDLIEYEGAKSFFESEDLNQIFITLLNDHEDYKQRCEASKNYVLKNRGATEAVMHYIEENRLLTS
jgi:3-deoxy-D-manno-octulosonic-acid transferase